MSRVLECGNYQNMTQAANGNIGPVGASIQLLGWYVNSTSAGTIVLTEVKSGGNVITGAITPAIGWHRFPLDAPNGLYATLGGTINVTFLYLPNS